LETNKPGLNAANQQFLERINEIIADQLSDERFGVSELAEKVHMSRSNLLRKIRKLTHLSASQYLRKVRLEKAHELLSDSGLTVTEACYKVGFSSTSYFIKCFHEEFGYSPGKLSRGLEGEGNAPGKTGRRWKKWLVPSAVLLILVIAAIVILPVRQNRRLPDEKSIAVLPFLNDSNDSSNVYFVNGMMESILNNLQKIEDLRVISRTSVESYRDQPKRVSEIARELDVRYIVEGSGQKIGNKVMLSVQLISAQDDRHLWSGQFSEELEDVFDLQTTIATTIAREVQARISPDEAQRIEKAPTRNLDAYDLYLKGRDLMFSEQDEQVLEGIGYFSEAIALDEDFALAYASISISYFLLDVNQYEKRYLEESNRYADQAMLLDPQLTQSLLAKALYYMNSYQYDQALSYLEKALEYNPNSLLIVNILSDFYTNYAPDSEKYLEYAIRGLKLQNLSTDSLTSSFTYLHIGNAFIQSGFVHEARLYLQKSLDYLPANIYSQYVLAYVEYAEHRDLGLLNAELLDIYQLDTTRMDVLQEIGKTFYFMRDFESARVYYEKYLALKERSGTNIFPSEDYKIAAVYHFLGEEEKAHSFFGKFKAFNDWSESIYKQVNYFMYYVSTGETRKALDALELFAEETSYHYWIIVFLESDPMLDEIKKLPEFRKTMDRIRRSFNKRYQEMRNHLKAETVI